MYMLAFVIALVISLCVTPLVRTIALRIGAVVLPNERSVHTTPTPHLGGIAIFAAFSIVALSAIPAKSYVGGILAGGLLMLLLGLWDDFAVLKARTKFIGQVIVALISVLVFDIRIEFITNPFGGFGHVIELGAWGVPLSVAWIVAVVNVVNLIDGLDGLAAGIASIAAFTLLFAALQLGNSAVVLLTAALAGSTLGFLPYNFNPAKIFMGDGGSHFIGFALASLSAEGLLKSATTIALVVPLLALALPIFDTSFAIVRRFAQGRPISEADRGHLHHRLLDRGLSQRKVVLIMYLISAYLGLGAVLVAGASSVNAAIILVFSLSSVLILGMKTGVLNIREKDAGGQ